MRVRASTNPQSRISATWAPMQTKEFQVIQVSCTNHCVKDAHSRLSETEILNLTFILQVNLERTQSRVSAELTVTTNPKHPPIATRRTLLTSRIEEALISWRKVQQEWEKIVAPCRSSPRLARECSALIELLETSMPPSSETPFKMFHPRVPQTD